MEKSWCEDGIIDTNAMIKLKKKLQNLKSCIWEWNFSKRKEWVTSKEDLQKTLIDLEG